MPNAKTMYVWPCGTWCWQEDIEEYQWMSDDYVVILVGTATSDETADNIAHGLVEPT